MTQKVITGNCISCESGFELAYHEEYVSSEYPTFCPFCGDNIEDITDEYIEEEETFEDDQWDKDY